MGLEIRPATPGTIVVLAATVLLVLVSVSVPLLKSIWFLKATIDTSVGSTDIKGEITLGAWGYCVGDTCTSAKLGYSLDAAELFGISEKISGISTSVLKWVTYLMILHPIAAGFGAISTIFGLLAHIRGFAGTALTTCFASFAATFSLLAFIFDIVVFVIAKQRIESSSVGGSAQLGAAVWMTLAAMIMFGLSGCFFGCGACVIRKRRASREASEKNRPFVDEAYGSKMRNDALMADAQHRREGTLPNFAEHEQNEQIPLTAMQDYDEGGDAGRYHPVRFASSTDVGAPSIISGVGEGYGRRNPSAPGMPVSITADSLASPGYAAPIPVGGVGSRLGAERRADRGRLAPGDEQRLAPARQASTATATTEPFVGMYGQQPMQGYSDPYAPRSTPSPVGGAAGMMSMPLPQVAGSSYGQPQQQQQQQQFSPTHAGGYPACPSGPSASSQHLSPTYGAAYPAYPASSSPAPAPAPAGTAYSTPYGSEKQPCSTSTSPPPQQQYHVQNPSYADPYATSNVDAGSIAPTYYTHDQQGYAGAAGGSSYGNAPPPVPQQSGLAYHSTRGSADQYGAPTGYGGAGRY
ncbi:hypothetical protein JCM10213_007213 [Rhodosporidiobolus nylandii]